MYKKWVRTIDEPTNYTYDKDVIEYIDEQIKLSYVVSICF